MFDWRRVGPDLSLTQLEGKTPREMRPCEAENEPTRRFENTLLRSRCNSRDEFFQHFFFVCFVCLFIPILDHCKTFYCILYRLMRLLILFHCHVLYEFQRSTLAGCSSTSIVQSSALPFCKLERVKTRLTGLWNKDNRRNVFALKETGRGRKPLPPVSLLELLSLMQFFQNGSSHRTFSWC